MKPEPISANASVFVPSDWWENMQTSLEDAVTRCVDMTAKIANHQMNGEYDAEELIDSLDSRVRTLRKQLEELIIPF